MLPPLSPIPSIEISLAPPEEIPVEPYSPFHSISFPCLPDDPDSPRSAFLQPPPTLSPFRNPTSPKHPSPLGMSASTSPSPAPGMGIDRDRFESMLRASRERNAVKKPTVDLRKEVALKAHKSRQAERRALFLSKIEAPPSPTATLMPVTPPDSPAVLHYSLPSPGLVSPIALFESLALEGLDDAVRRNWVEHVDFQAAAPEWDDKAARRASVRRPGLRHSALRPLPSLDQISARIGGERKAGAAALPIGPAPTAPTRAPIPLPAFLHSGRPRPESLPAPRERDTGRQPPTPLPAPHPKFNVATTIVEEPAATDRSGAAQMAGTPLTARNLSLLESRNEKGKAMLEKILRRVSSPAELERAGRRRGEVFGEHRVFDLPGGF